MRIRGCTVEYELDEAAKMLAIPPDELKRGVEAGHLRYYYQIRSNEPRFHDASILANQALLAQKPFRTRRNFI